MFLHIKKTAYILLVAVFLFVLDRYLKYLALGLDGKEINLVSDFFKFNFVKNYFIAFSIPLSGNFLLILILLILLTLLYFIYKLIKERKILESSLLLCVFAGAISNLYDRLEYGYVVDYLDLKYFTVFNVADTMIVCGVIIFLFVSIKNDRQKT
ncbi:signal peptidase II [Candidatus Parcubacteria bacterium]|nr:MAG: signal peptidase II [Candidatus Parcubacteria bacterium]